MCHATVHGRWWKYKRVSGGTINGYDAMGMREQVVRLSMPKQRTERADYSPRGCRLWRVRPAVGLNYLDRYKSAPP